MVDFEPMCRQLERKTGSIRSARVQRDRDCMGKSF